MYHYNIVQWILIFFIYGFLGWVFETTYVSVKKRKFVNRGFLRGPILPIYASGAMIMLFASIPFSGNLVATYFAGMVAATILEYFVGIGMEALFKVKYWDYSNQKFQYKGVICLSSSIAWGFLTLLMTEVIHKPIEKLLFSIPEIMIYPVTIFILCLFCVDTVISVKAAIDVRVMLEQMERMKTELEEMEEKLLFQLSERKENLLENVEEKADALREILEERKDVLRETVEGKVEAIQKANAERRQRLADYMENSHMEISENAPELWSYYESMKEKVSQYKALAKKNFGARNYMFYAHPSATSGKYKRAFLDMKVELQLQIAEKKKLKQGKIK